MIFLVSCEKGSLFKRRGELRGCDIGVSLLEACHDKLPPFLLMEKEENTNSEYHILVKEKGAHPNKFGHPDNNNRKPKWLAN